MAEPLALTKFEGATPMLQCFFHALAHVGNCRWGLCFWQISLTLDIVFDHYLNSIWLVFDSFDRYIISIWSVFGNFTLVFGKYLINI